MLPPKTPRLIRFGLVLFTVLIILLDSAQKVSTGIFTNDLIAWLLPAVAPLKGWGVPYLNYWDIKPPGLLLMTVLLSVVGSPLWWFNLLSIGLHFLISWLYWRILRRGFSWLLSSIIYIFSTLVFFSPGLQTQLLPSEINGVFWALLGLDQLLGQRTLHRRIFLSSLAFTLAGQMKEVFAFSLLSMAPLYFQIGLAKPKELMKAVGSAIGGITTGLGLIVGYLLATGSLQAYREIYAIKSEAYHLDDFYKISPNIYTALQFPHDRFLLVNYSLIWLFISTVILGWLALIYSKKLTLLVIKKSKVIQLKLPSQSYVLSSFVCFWLGSWLGYMLQKSWGNKYDLAILFPFYLLMGVLIFTVSNSVIILIKTTLQIPKKNFQLVTTLVLAGLFLVLLFPQRVYFQDWLFRFKTFRLTHYLAGWSQLEKPSLIPSEQKLRDGTPTSSCIQAVYGWGMGTFYYYAERPPCNRYFIPNIVSPNQASDYRSALINRPPAAIYYTTEKTDINIDRFEQEIFNYSQVLQHCYQPDPQDKYIYWPKTSLDAKTLSDCIATSSASLSQ